MRVQVSRGSRVSPVSREISDSKDSLEGLESGDSRDGWEILETLEHADVLVPRDLPDSRDLLALRVREELLPVSSLSVLIPRLHALVVRYFIERCLYLVSVHVSVLVALL